MKKNLRKLKKASIIFLSAMMVVTLLNMSVYAQEKEVDGTDNYDVQLYAKVTDAGQVVNKMVIDYGSAQKVSGVDKDTFTVHAKASTEAIRQGTEDTSYGDYDIDRTIVKVEVDGSKVTVYFDETEGATLAYLSSARNYPADLTYTITQNKAITLTALDGRTINDNYVATYSCDNSIIDSETAKFESVKVEDGINYQFYNAGNADKLIVWFHGNGEGDYLSSGNNVAQMLANRGTVVWATDEAQDIFGGAYVMAFQAPDTWYYAQNDKLLEKAYNEIMDVVEKYDIDPDKILVSGCSAGGYMTTRMIIAYPELFAAAMINCPALDVADARGGETPTDAELESIRDSKTAIWLVQGETDSSVATDACSKRMFNILTEGAEVSEKKYDNGELASYFTTYETADGKYKLSLYETTEDGKLKFAEDYDQDGVETQVLYSNHWSWIYTLNNNPKAADGTTIWAWAASYVADKAVDPEVPSVNPANPTTPTDSTNTGNTTPTQTNVKTGDYTNVAPYAFGILVGIAGISYVYRRRKENS